MDGLSEERIFELESRIAQLEAVLAQNGNASDGSSGEGARNAYIPPLAEPPKLAAFSVVWEDDTWKMYYPSGCLLCDGHTPIGINAGADGMVNLEAGLTTVGIRATWKKNKKTGAISDLIAKISGSSESNIFATESGTGETAVWMITANIPVAKIENLTVNQIANGFISISSGTGEHPEDGRLTLKDEDGNVLGYFTANQSENKEIVIPSGAKDGKLTLKDGDGNVLGYFTANQSEDKDIVIPKPEIPTVNNGKLTIKYGATEKGSFTANQSSNTEIVIPEPEIPTVNNGKLTIKYGTTEKGSFTANQSSNTEIVIPEPEIPLPITPNDGKLKVQFGTDAAVDKFSANQAGDSTLQLAKVASTGSYNDLTDKPKIPTPLSGTLKYIGEDGVRYDLSTKQLQIRVDTLDLATGQVTPGNWTMITGGQAVPLPIMEEQA